MQPNKEQTNTEMAQVEKIIGVILQIGVLISAIIIGIGLLLLLFTGHSGYSGQNFPTQDRVQPKY